MGSSWRRPSGTPSNTVACRVPAKLLNSSGRFSRAVRTARALVLVMGSVPTAWSFSGMMNFRNLSCPVSARTATSSGLALKRLATCSPRRAKLAGSVGRASLANSSTRCPRSVASCSLISVPQSGPPAPIIIANPLQDIATISLRTLRRGARQESRRSRRHPFGSAFPKVLKTSTQFAAAQSDDGVGTANGPMHPGPFEPGSDGHFASGLHNASGSTQALGVELRVAHAVSVGLEIVHATAGFFGVSHMAANRGEGCLEPSGVEFLLPSFRPLGSSRVGRAIKSFAEVTQVLLGVKAVDDLGRSGEQLLHLVPDPGSPIPERRRTLGLAEAAALGFAPDALGEGGTFLGGVRCGGTLDGRGIGNGSFIADGNAVLIE